MPKTTTHIHCILATILIGLSLVVSAPANAETLRFCYDPYPPYTIVEDNRPLVGIKVDLLNAVVNRIDGLDATVQILPWKRCQSAVQLGEIDGILPLFQNDERRNYMTFSTDVLDEKSVFWARKGNPRTASDWQGDYSRISDLRLGMLRGSFIDRRMEAAFTANAEIARASSIEALFQMLQHDRIDLVATDFSVGRYVASQQDSPDEFYALDPPIAGRSSQFGLSRFTGADRHTNAFNRALGEIRASGEIDRILDKY